MEDVEVRLLGPVGLWRGDVEAPLVRSHLRCLLAALALYPGRPVSLESLVDRVWGERPPPSANHSVYSHVSALRRALKDLDPGADRVQIHQLTGGYALNIDSDQVDLHRARRHANAARAIPADQTDRDRHAAELLRKSCALWRGPPLTGLGGDWAARVREGLDQERLAVLAERLRLELRLGDHVSAMGELSTLLPDYPLVEPLVELQMLALYRCGRQADALALYRQTRRRLIEEVGDEPGVRLQRLHEETLRRDPCLDLVARASGPAANSEGEHPTGQSALPVATSTGLTHLDLPAGEAAQETQPLPQADRRAATATPAQLPPDVAAFTGRTGDLAALDALLPDPVAQRPSPVAVIGGTAGVGKTALAVHWAHRMRTRFPDGQLYVNLRGYASGSPLRPAQVLTRFLHALGVPAQRVPDESEEAAALYRSVLADRAVLVVLDNANAPEQVRPLLPSGPGSMALVTCRDRLDGLVARDGARPLTLGPLAPSEAVSLLARVIGPDRVAAEPDATAEAAQRCGRLPLALCIAAANLAAHPRRRVADYVDRLRGEEHLTALAVPGDPDSAVSAAFDLSYARLAPAARRMFRLLGLVPGPEITADAAAAMTATDRRSADSMLEQLATAHLVEEHVARRYSLLDPLRFYATDRAMREETAAVRGQARTRLFDHYLHLADAAANLTYPNKLRLRPPTGQTRPALDAFPDHARALAWLDDELPGLIAIVTSASADGPRPVSWLLAGAIRGHLEARRLTGDRITAGRAALAAAEAEGALDAQAHARFGLADARAARRDYRQSIALYRHALSIANRLSPTENGQPGRLIEFKLATLNNIGVVAAESGAPRRAADYLARAVRLARSSGIVAALPFYLGNLAEMYVLLGRLEEASHHYAEALAINRKRGDRKGEARELYRSARAHHAMGHFDRAIDHLTDALPLARLVGDRIIEAKLHSLRAAVLRDTGAPAEDSALTGLAIAKEIGDDSLTAEALNTLGTIYHARGDHQRAIDHHRKALTLARRAESTQRQTEALIALAAAHLATGDHTPARDCLDTALPPTSRAGYRLLESTALTVLADLHLAGADTHQAREVGERAMNIHRKTGHRLGQARAHLILGHVHHRAGDQRAARRHWERAHQLFTDLGVPDAEQTAPLLTSMPASPRQGTTVASGEPASAPRTGPNHSNNGPET
jgi:DNA-binding SARP family transcriptional activator/Tfp pilus assembly protein PilF